MFVFHQTYAVNLSTELCFSFTGNHFHSSISPQALPFRVSIAPSQKQNLILAPIFEVIKEMSRKVHLSGSVGTEA
jgi:hypothetical protein